MAAEEAGWHEEAAKLCGDDDLVAVAGDRSSSSSIFNLDDINLDDIFLDLNDADMFPSFAGGADGHPPQGGGLFSSGAVSLQGSAPAEDAPVSVDHTPAAAAAAGGALLSEGLQLCDDIDATELEWLSNFCEESYSSDGLGCFIPCNTGGVGAFHVPGGGDGENKKMGPHVNVSTAGAGTAGLAKDERNFRTSSPISVLEHGGLIVGISPPTSFSTTATTSSTSTSSLSSPTSSSCSGVGGGLHREPKPSGPPEPGLVPARSRSKRPRPANFSPRPPIVIPVLPPSSETSAALSSSTITAPLAGSEEHGSFDPVAQDNQLENAESVGKKKKKKPTPPAAADVGEEAAVTSSPAPAPVRKCMHCEITKTPQWRAGPMGPKTLCNACGVRYKSGRLFPEYRPAASPTFVAALHSNSHKKVVEMRNNTVLQDTSAAAAAAKPGNRRRDVASKACELLEYIRRREWCTTDNRITSE